MDLSANFYTAHLLKYAYIGSTAEITEEILDELLYNGIATIDLSKLFDELFGRPTAYGAPVSAARNEDIPVVNGLFDTTFLFSARASMDNDGHVILTRGSQSIGAIDIGEMLFDSLEAEGETSITMSSEVTGDSMQSILAGMIGMFTDSGSSEDVEEVLKAMGAEYSSSNVSIQHMNRVCDQKMREISRYATSDTNDTPVYITIGIVAVLALAILMISYVKKD